jgi:hypothetical protein
MHSMWHSMCPCGIPSLLRWGGLRALKTWKVMPEVAWQLAESPLQNRRRGGRQTKRNTSILQVGGREDRLVTSLLERILNVTEIKQTNILSRSMCDYRRGFDWILDSLTTLTHNS